MPLIRILFANASRELYASIASAVERHAELVIVANIHGDREILLRAGEVRADVVILEADRTDCPPLVERLTDEYPHILILITDSDLRYAFLYRRRPEYYRIENLTASGLVKAISRAAGF